MPFTIFQNEKTPFSAIKTRSSKTSKIDIFPKGLTHGFRPKIAIFPPLIFQEIKAKKMSFTIFENKKTPLQAIKKRTSKAQKIDFFPKALTHGFGPKMVFLHFLSFQEIQAMKMSFTIFQKKKTPFQATKTRSSKTRKFDIFQKRLTHGFGLKMTIFPIFYFQEIYVRKMPLTIFQNEKRLSRLQKQEVQKLVKLAFFQRG